MAVFQTLYLDSRFIMVAVYLYLSATDFQFHYQYQSKKT